MPDLEGQAKQLSKSLHTSDLRYSLPLVPWKRNNCSWISTIWKKIISFTAVIPLLRMASSGWQEVEVLTWSWTPWLDIVRLIASWECVTSFDRFDEIERRNIDSKKQLFMISFFKNLFFIDVDLAGIAEQRTSVDRKILQTTMSMFETQKLQPPYPLHLYQLQDMEKAFRFLQSGKSSEKIVLEVNLSAKLPVSPTKLVLGNVDDL